MVPSMKVAQSGEHGYPIQTTFTMQLDAIGALTPLKEHLQ